jgi:hypothetical protein
MSTLILHSLSELSIAFGSPQIRLKETSTPNLEFPRLQLRSLECAGAARQEKDTAQIGSNLVVMKAIQKPLKRFTSLPNREKDEKLEDGCGVHSTCSSPPPPPVPADCIRFPSAHERDVDWIGVAQNRGRRRAVVNAVANRLVPQNFGTLSSDHTTGGLSSSASASNGFVNDVSEHDVTEAKTFVRKEMDTFQLYKLNAGVGIRAFIAFNFYFPANIQVCICIIEILFYILR